MRSSTFAPLSGSRSDLECAQAIADLIVHDGLTWSLARNRVLSARGRAPNPALIESAVRQTFSLYYAEQHAQQLRRQRQAALQVLRLLGDFRCYLTGAVLNGAAGPESTVIIEVFEDNPKAVEVAFLDAGVQIEAVSPLKSLMPPPLECLGFLMPLSGTQDLQAVRVNIQAASDERINPARKLPDQWQNALESRGRASLQELTVLLEETPY